MTWVFSKLAANARTIALLISTFLSPNGGEALVASTLTADPGTSNIVSVVEMVDITAPTDSFRLDAPPGVPVFAPDYVQALVARDGKSTISALRRMACRRTHGANCG